MESHNHQNDVRARSARKLNDALANRIIRWKRFRLSFAIALAMIGICAFFFNFYLLSVPLFICSLILTLLYLDARDQLREVLSRNWISATPRIRRPSGESQTKMPDPTAHQ